MVKQASNPPSLRLGFERALASLPAPVPCLFLQQAYTGTLFSRSIVTGLVVSGVLGFLMGIVTVMQIRVTSPLTHNISGTAKAGVQSIMAFYIWDNEATVLACVGEKRRQDLAYCCCCCCVPQLVVVLSNV